MNRTDRLLAILLELQRKGARRAEDLAATFETSKRTIYRDIQALCESGVPVVAQPGVGYSLVEGYFLPPVSFSVDEATMLLLGADSAAQNFDAQYRDAAASAGRKIEAVLSEKLRGEVEYLRGNIAFVAPATLASGKSASFLPQLRRAIIERRTIRFDYHTRYSQDGRDSRNTRGRPLCDVALRRLLVSDRPLPPPKRRSQLPPRPHDWVAPPRKDLQPTAEFQTRRAC
jgi:predicted DNA-binding transcriptional regulator YafY